MRDLDVVLPELRQPLRVMEPSRLTFHNDLTRVADDSVARPDARSLQRFDQQIGYSFTHI